MKRLVILLSALALLAWPAVVSADHGTDSVRGNVRLFGQIEVNVSARSSQAGSDASGRVTFTNTITDPNQTWRGDVTCLRIVGATATTAATFYTVARVTDAPPGDFAQSIHVFGTDAGKFAQAPDTLAAFTSSLPAPPDGACPVPTFSGSPVSDGEVTIHNSLP